MKQQFLQAPPLLYTQGYEPANITLYIEPEWDWFVLLIFDVIPIFDVARRPLIPKERTHVTMHLTIHFMYLYDFNFSFIFYCN